MIKISKIVLTNSSPGLNANSEELAKIIIDRIGLMPRKKGSTDKMHNVLIELYERSKDAYREKKPESAVVTVENMALLAGITRQTMYEYLNRWIDLNLISKTSYIKDGKVIIGYKLNGNTLENAFEKVRQRVADNLDQTAEYIGEVQKLLKNEKISESQKAKLSGND
ncbi:hypothetical protein JW968_00615 [Candidatus Woesearchaeota archaeon]|nr:hypothetical protein [Candidatus Woesearchaeota archaeon]